MRWLLAILLLIAALAGCTDSADDSTADGIDGEASIEAEPVYETVTITETIETEVEWLDGETDEGAWACGAPNCPGGHAPTADNSYVYTQEFEGNLSHLTLDLDWTPADATQATGLEIQITETQSGNLVGFWSGTSSFTIDADVSGASEQSLTIMVWPANKDGGATYVDATAQDFTLIGTIFSEVTRTEERLVEDA